MCTFFNSLDKSNSIDIQLANEIVEILLITLTQDEWKVQENSKSSIVNFQKRSIWRTLCILSPFVSSLSMEKFLRQQPQKDGKNEGII
jgi:hypothetical protein